MKIINEFDYTDRIRGQYRRISLEKIAKAVNSEHLLKDFRKKKEDILIDRNKHRCVPIKTNNTIKRKEKGLSPFTSYSSTPRIHYNDINSSDWANTIITPNLFYHPYSFTPLFVTKHYPQNKKYEEYLPKNSYREISIKEEIISNSNIHSKILKMGSFKGEKTRYNNKLNLTKYKDENTNTYTINQNERSNQSSSMKQKMNVNTLNNNKVNTNLHHIKSYSFLNNEKDSLIMNNEGKRDCNHNQSYSAETIKHLRGFNLSPNNKYTLINKNILEKNNNKIINCIQLKHQPTISKEKILITSLNKSIFSITNDRLYKRVMLLDKKLRDIMDKRSYMK